VFDAFNVDISSWDVSSVVIMEGSFRQAINFNQDLSNWNVSNVNNMNNMFREADNFNGDISTWDVSNTNDMGSMFLGAESFNQNISNWNVSNVIDMERMFREALVFNQDLSGWDVSNVVDMETIFQGANALSDENQCAIHTTWSSNGVWPYDWSENIDECGICFGNGIPEGECDCSGNIEDCAGDCGGGAVTDECGICDGIGLIDYWYDLDGDGLGSGDSSSYCEENAPDGWVANGDDLEPGCPTNDTDSCGICAGENEQDLGCGCFVPGPIDYWFDFDEDGLGAGSASSALPTHPSGALPSQY
jgi:surface protein